jgi:hypothetical protein
VNNKSVLLDINQEDLDYAKDKVEGSLGLSLVLHESEYHGGNYFRYDADNVSLLLQENFVEDDGERTEAEFPDSRLLIRIDGSVEVVSRMEATLTEGGASIRVLRARIY